MLITVLATVAIAACGETIPNAREEVVALVDVGGHRLETLVIGEGSPPVVFEAGFGGGMEGWRAIQDSVSRTTLTISYERAGLGESEPGPEPRSASQIAVELNTLLSVLGVDDPIVLVGHSAGGMFARVFAATYPERIAALVFVDPATEEMYEHMRDVDSERWNGYEGEAAGWPAPFGWYGQWRALPQSMTQARAAWPLPTVPMIVFTASQPLTAAWPVDTPEHMRLWGETHAALVSRLGGIEHVVLPSADHVSILRETAVLDAIVRFVEAMRALPVGAS